MDGESNWASPSGCQLEVEKVEQKFYIWWDNLCLLTWRTEQNLIFTCTYFHTFKYGNTNYKTYTEETALVYSVIVSNAT